MPHSSGSSIVNQALNKNRYKLINFWFAYFEYVNKISIDVYKLCENDLLNAVQCIP